MPDFIHVTTTTERREDAERIANALVEARLAACVQVLGPVTSVYRWRGHVETATEWLCLIKTERRLFRQLEATLRALHPYEVPELLAVPVVEGSEEYLSWLVAQLEPED